MVLDLARLFETSGEEASFCHSVDLSGYEQAGAHPLKQPAVITGSAVNAADIVTVTYRIEYIVETVCDRCLAALAVPRVIENSQMAVKALSGEDHDAFLVLPEAKLDVDALVYTDIILDLPSKNLCGEDCRGLCPLCGVNRNKQACGCERTVGDPRLQALRDLLLQ